FLPQYFAEVMLRHKIRGRDVDVDITQPVDAGAGQHLPQCAETAADFQHGAKHISVQMFFEKSQAQQVIERRAAEAAAVELEMLYGFSDRSFRKSMQVRQLRRIISRQQYAVVGQCRRVAVQELIESELELSVLGKLASNPPQ